MRIGSNTIQNILCTICINKRLTDEKALLKLNQCLFVESKISARKFAPVSKLIVNREPTPRDNWMENQPDEVKKLLKPKK